VETPLSPGKGARRAFDPATIQVTRHQQDEDEQVAAGSPLTRAG